MIVQPEIRLCSQAIEHVDIRKSVPAVENCETNELIELVCIAYLDRELNRSRQRKFARRARTAREPRV